MLILGILTNKRKGECALPLGPGAKLGDGRIEVVGREVIGWVMGVVGAMVVTDTFSTDRQRMGWHTHTQILLSTACREHLNTCVAGVYSEVNAAYKT